MKNYEKYADEIREYKGQNFCNDFVKPNILESDCCDGVNCSRCYMLQMLWLMKEYEEPEVDWSKVEVDTPILVRQGKNGEWLERHFAKYENGNVYTWVDGQTSWTEEDKIKWRYAKLPEDEKKPEIDWSKVEVDTPILVRDFEGSAWFRRHFAKYENGTVYAWDGGDTSWSGGDVMTEWKYAKLAESEEECKESKVDWSKVEVNTPILVRHDECDKWSYRYFAKYENGVVYAWHCGHPNWAKDYMVRWEYAKLAKSEEE